MLSVSTGITESSSLLAAAAGLAALLMYHDRITLFIAAMAVIAVFKREP